MLLLELFSNPLTVIIFLTALVVAITVHEFAHAWAADRLGDDTPRLMGRVTLNPLSHLDPIGSIAFLLVGFGWGRPVQYNPMRLSRKTDELLIALAGPASNLILAIIFNALTVLTLTYNLPFLEATILQEVAAVNVILAAFNMLPIPPLDGSSIVAYFWPEYRSMMGGQIGLIILLLLIFTGTLTLLVSPVIDFFTHIATLFGVFGFDQIFSTIFGVLG